MDTPGKRLKAAREAAGFPTAKAAAIAMGVPIATYTQHELAHRWLPARRADQYAVNFHTTPEWLLYGRNNGHEHTPSRIPIIGQEVFLGAETVFSPRPVSKMTRAIQIRSDDALGEAVCGWFALFDLPQGPPDITEKTSQLSVACIPNQNGASQYYLLCRVRASATPGLYHLLGPAEPILDHAIVWAAPVHCIVPG